jgi:hypothetical protein
VPDRRIATSDAAVAHNARTRASTVNVGSTGTTVPTRTYWRAGTAALHSAA